MPLLGLNHLRLVFLELSVNSFCKENLQEGLVRDVPLVGEKFEVLQHGLREPQRNRLG